MNILKPLPMVLCACLCAVPALILIWRAISDALGPDPAQELALESGIWSLRLLLATLAISPLSRLFVSARLIRYRRVLGLATFAYVSCHLLIYLSFLLGWDFADFAGELAKRPYVLVGFSAWLMLLPLAATSNRMMMRRLRKNWKRLHRAIYLITALGVLHFVWLSKTLGEPMIYVAILVILLAERVVRWFVRVLHARFRSS